MEKMPGLESAAWFKGDDSIPEWLLIELLLRLPVKIVFRFKLVSKQWLAIISHRSFVRMYISRVSPLQHWSLITNDMYIDGSEIKMSFMDLNISSFRVHSFPCTQQPLEESYQVFCVSNGLVLYGPASLKYPGSFESHFPSYSICNPMTAEWITLPSHKCEYSGIVLTGFLTYVEDEHFQATYKVVRLDQSNQYNIRFEMFDSETGDWKDISVCINERNVECIPCQTPAVVNGLLHWMTFKHGVLAIDTNNFAARIISLPPAITPEDANRGINLCEAHQGQLRYIEAFGKLIELSGFDIWMLDDYESGVWSLKYKVRYLDLALAGILHGQTTPPSLVTFHAFDPEIVYLGYEGVVLSYNVKTKKGEAHDYPCYMSNGELVKWTDGWLWTLPFAIPPWPISIAPPRRNIA